VRIFQHAPEDPAIEIEMPPTHEAGFAALVRLRDEHDLSTAREVKAALGSISGSVLVDLADCAFIDASIIGALITTSQELERDGHVLALFVPVENTTVARTLEITQMRELVVMHDTRPGSETPG
jgi:anti-anti-sigma factor